MEPEEKVDPEHDAGGVIVTDPPEREHDDKPEPTEAERLRAELAALKDEVEDLRRRPAPEAETRKAEPTAENVEWTSDLVRKTQEAIDAKWRAGDIDDAQRAAAYSTLSTRVELQAADRRRQAREAAERTTGEAQRRIQKLVKDNPELGQKGSALLQSVGAQLDDLADLGMDPKDPRTQLLAAERAIQAKARGEGDREYERRRRPVGGGGGGMTPADGHGGGTKGKTLGEKVWDVATEETRTTWLGLARGDKAAALKTLNHADPSKLFRAGRLTRMPA